MTSNEGTQLIEQVARRYISLEESASERVDIETEQELSSTLIIIPEPDDHRVLLTTMMIIGDEIDDLDMPMMIPDTQYSTLFQETVTMIFKRVYAVSD